MSECPICHGRSHKFVTKTNDNGSKSYDYYECESCGTLFIDPRVLSAIDNGMNLVEYTSEYWENNHLSSANERTWGPNMARMAETLYYARQKVRLLP